ncbi:ubiquitin carboxyl-terminal hydrolase [Thecamonas trahens ATCC 50062]|uniref:Ubiquitin carboxyl-terminal hydrolase n=1 Tax=Thecamonas trahens ATCC 50062 TaxID=461836 RepID=A0A0L0DP49_THETB|nr:ubiquitin carboxyl-terminal hydrolase [Thecamonas trahens ATCC 50062]KNC54064.1 ubiquitin carboxyl-terminal hydrolase [Thecamonas trahens ATCC 50062]|eukprot:XP_013754073.1 ubiquitin carboxyl-terminal hydrolase [Thecamonas trahens ATCC 50062]
MQSTYNLKVKWGKQMFDVEVQTSEPVTAFKAQLYSLTGVPVEKQKIMGLKGGNVKDNAKWEELGLKEGKKVMLIGSAEEMPPPPTEKVVFVEDLSVEDQARLAVVNPPGLQNLGNTCYLNATLQCFRGVPELAAALAKYAPQEQSPPAMLTAAIRGLWEEVSASTDKVVPLSFVMMFRQLLPQFAERAQNGGFKQQDAEECWTTLLSMLSTQLPRNAMDKLFMGELTETMQCLEAADEPPSVRTSTFGKLTCNITADTNYLVEGLKAGMSEEIEKSSSSLGRSALYLKSAAISKLPAYLTVSMVRFFWKANDQVKAKILRSVKFPMELDVFDMCSPDLQAKLRVNREVILAAQEAATEAALDARAGSAAKDKDDAEAAPADDEPAPMDVAAPSSLTPSTSADAAASFPYAPLDIDNMPDLPNKTGMYELCGVVTHQGRSADAGHYVGWVRDAGDRWMKFDDDVVTEVSPDEILKLSGGGDWHVGYILLYRCRRHPELESASVDAPAASSSS